MLRTKTAGTAWAWGCAAEHRTAESSEERASLVLPDDAVDSKTDERPLQKSPGTKAANRQELSTSVDNSNSMQHRKVWARHGSDVS